MQVESQLHKQKLVQLNKIETIKKKYNVWARKDLDEVQEIVEGGRRVNTSKNKDKRPSSKKRETSQSAKKLVRLNNAPVIKNQSSGQLPRKPVQMPK